MIATDEYMAGNVDGLSPPDDYAHDADLSQDALDQLSRSVFLDQMSPDSVIVIDASDGPVQDITPGRGSVGAFYIGQEVADVIAGRNGGDHIEGFGGDDTLFGAFGSDTIAGGTGLDLIYGNQHADLVYGNLENDTLFGGQAGDVLFAGRGSDLIYGNQANDLIYGNRENDTIFAGAGDDTVYGGQGDDVLFGNIGNDVLLGNVGADVLVFGANSGDDKVIGFDAAQGDLLDIQGQSHTTQDTPEGLVLELSGGGSVLLVGLHDIADVVFA